MEAYNKALRALGNGQEVQVPRPHPKFSMQVRVRAPWDRVQRSGAAGAGESLVSTGQQAPCCRSWKPVRGGTAPSSQATRRSAAIHLFMEPPTPHADSFMHA